MTTTDGHARRGLSVRTRITAAVALLVTVALAGAGVIVHWIESRAIVSDTQREVEQELDEFVALQATGDFGSIPDLLEGFLVRNVPDDDELLVGWVGDRPIARFPGDDLVDEPAFRDAAAPLVAAGGTTYLDTAEGEVRITSQPVRRCEEAGALLVVTYLAEDRDELLSTMRTYTVVAGSSPSPWPAAATASPASGSPTDPELGVVGAEGIEPPTTSL